MASEQTNKEIELLLQRASQLPRFSSGRVIQSSPVVPPQDRPSSLMLVVSGPASWGKSLQTLQITTPIQQGTRVFDIQCIPERSSTEEVLWHISYDEMQLESVVTLVEKYSAKNGFYGLELNYIGGSADDGEKSEPILIFEIDSEELKVPASRRDLIAQTIKTLLTK